MHRFQETIHGRHVAIEVAPVDPDRWRAYVVREPGGPAAMMPFYGSTPQEAARHLRDWLALAYRDESDSV